MAGGGGGAGLARGQLWDWAVAPLTPASSHLVPSAALTSLVTVAIVVGPELVS